MTIPAKPSGVNLTERDIRVLDWLREVRIASSAGLLAAYSHFGGEEMDQRRFSRRILKLEQAGTVGSAFMTHGRQHKVYWPADRPYRLARRELSHDLLLAEFSIWLVSQRHDGLALTEHVPAERWKTPAFTADHPLNPKSHAADGMVWLPDQRIGLVEIELSPKSGRKLRTVLDSHAARLDSSSEPISGVLYLTTERAGKTVANAWKTFGHAVDHPGRFQVLHAVDDHTLTRRTELIELN
ncbi:hypothetical protein [Nocardia sp. alder85J]|uniref:hypothetical protein n=1 Tax=Nocardia sp. alder85J TaxID=2862949 RepID=UPI001CD5D02E|nr:hypothetical protein [Nocardia sp. alder85J]MCX4099110.1 hypothetical protein [Nocardia sp. alder85J]